MSSEHNSEVMRVYLEEVLHGRKFELIPDFVAPDMIDHTQPNLRGVEALDAHARGFCTNIPDATIEVIRIFANDETAVGVWRWEGTPNQPMALSASGGQVYPHVVASIFDFKDGLLAEYQPFVDAVEIRNQLAN